MESWLKKTKVKTKMLDDIDDIKDQTSFLHECIFPLRKGQKINRLNRLSSILYNITSVNIIPVIGLHDIFLEVFE